MWLLTFLAGKVRNMGQLDLLSFIMVEAVLASKVLGGHGRIFSIFEKADKMIWISCKILIDDDDNFVHLSCWVVV